MTDKPLVSIITPTYNHERFLSYCIESVINQTYERWEMIIVNDGSSDLTATIAESYSQKDNRIKVFNRNNIGIFRLAETYNYALSVASGKYVAILEGDDTWISTKLETQVQGLENNPNAVLSWGSANAVAISGEILNRYPVRSEDYTVFMNSPVGSIMRVLLFRNVIPALTILVRKNTIDSIGGFQQKHGLPLIDIPTLHMLALQGEFVYHDEVLGIWRIYGNQITKTYPVQIYKGFYKLASEFQAKNIGFTHGLNITKMMIAMKKFERNYYQWAMRVLIDI